MLVRVPAGETDRVNDRLLYSRPLAEAEGLWQTVRKRIPGLKMNVTKRTVCYPLRLLCFLGLGGLFLFSACGGDPHPHHEDHHHDDAHHHGEHGEGPRTVLTVNELYQVTYEPDPDPIPHNESFSVEVSITEPLEPHDPVTGVTLSRVDALMPSHGHGMNTVTSVESLGDGRFQVEGFLFHMGGHWHLEVDVDGPVGEDRAVFHLECCE